MILQGIRIEILGYLRDQGRSLGKGIEDQNGRATSLGARDPERSQADSRAWIEMLQRWNIRQKS